MIFSVLLSVVSLAFGVYKNVEAGNAKGFAYEQAYRIMGVVQKSDISSGAKASILNAALGSLTTPPPVLDLSRSSASVPTTQVCSEQQVAQCGTLAANLAAANTTCSQSKGTASACALIGGLKTEIANQQCVICFTK